MKDLIVRDAIESDLDCFNAIRMHPEVRRQQYPFMVPGYLEQWRRLITGELKWVGVERKYNAIVLDERIVGYIGQDTWNPSGILKVQCGWNLSPEFWGRGIMYEALKILLKQFFERGVEYVFADYFRGNLRCERLIKKLGFSKIPIFFLERISTALELGCYRWVIRTMLDRKTWLDNHVP